MKEVNEREEVYQQETYRLTFEHFIYCDGKRIKLEEPLFVQMAIDRNIPSPLCINRMLDMMRSEIIIRMELEVNQNERT